MFGLQRKEHVTIEVEVRQRRLNLLLSNESMTPEGLWSWVLQGDYADLKFVTLKRLMDAGKLGNGAPSNKRKMVSQLTTED